MNTYSNVRQRAFGHAAAVKRAEREQRSAAEEWTVAEQAQDLLKGLSLEVNARKSHEDRVEVARGRLVYKNRPMYVILRKHESEPGAGLLSLYTMEQLDWFAFQRKDAVTMEPHRSLLIRADDAVALEKQEAGNKLSIVGEKRYTNTSDMQQGGYWKTMHFSPEAHHFSVLLTGDESWLNLDSGDSTIDVWMNALRVLQSVGTCLEDGRCLVQCTYLKSIEGCNFDAFCNLEKSADANHYWARPRCTPKVTKKDNLEGWKEFQAEVRSKANWILNTGCMAACQKTWSDVTHGVNLANELKKQYWTIADKPMIMEHLPKETLSILQEISAEVDDWVNTIAGKLSRGFDFGRSQPLSVLKGVLRNKGCSDMPEGSLRALFHLNSAPDDKQAQANFKVYEDSCPWFMQLAGGDAGKLDEGFDDEDESLPMTSLDEFLGEPVSRNLSETGFQSLIQNGGGLVPLADIIVVSAVVSATVMIFAGVALVIKGAFCGVERNDEAGEAHKHCKLYLEPGGPCWHNNMLPGIYMMFGGVVVLALTGLAVWAVMGGGAALIPGAWEWAVGGGATLTGGGTLAGLYQMIKSKFVNEKTAETKYVECMGRLADVIPDTPDNSGPTNPRVIHGAEELFEKVSLASEQEQALSMELLTLGILSIHELRIEDWEELKSFETLTKFEKKRLRDLVKLLPKK